MSFARYPKYKDSGVEWLGEVPEHWDVSPLKYQVRLRSGGTPSKENLAYWNGDVPWASSKDLKSEVLSDTQDHITNVALEEGAATLVPPGSLLVVVRGMILAHTFPVTKALVPMAINQDLKAVTPRDRYGTDFLAWLLRGTAGETLNRLDEAAHGTKALRLEAWGSLGLPIPPREEQDGIVGFLARETAKVDALIAEQQRLMELLKEKRQAVISHAVTKGLNPGAPMKPSGIEWLGDVPTHWHVPRMKDVVVERVAGPYGASLTKDMYTTSGFRVYGQQQVIADDFGIGDYYIPASKFDEMRRYEVFPDDVLVSVMGTIGKVAVVPKDVEPGIINPRLVRYRCSASMMPRYLQAVLMSHGHQEFLAFEAKGTTMDGLNMGILGQTPVPLPPKAEQLQILAHLVHQAGQFDALTAEAQRAIDLLQERRMALISAAVTGQIDVRNLA